MRVPIKPMTVNRAWQGRRFKTPEYKTFERDVLLLLKPMEIPEGPLEARFVFGVSNMLTDWDNPVKPFQDCLQKKYGFNDNRIHKATVEKLKVPKGEEYIEFDLKQLEAA